MIQVNPTLATHSFSFIPRVTPLATIVLELYNEVTQVKTTVANTYTLLNGIMSVTFDFTFAEKDKYQIKITDANGVIYRGKLIATVQTAQTYTQTKDLYFYE